MIKSGQLYKHYKPKGNTYQIKDVAEPLRLKPEHAKINQIMTVTHTEDKDLQGNNLSATIYYTDAGIFIDREKKHVLYHVHGQKTPLWARPYEMFIENVYLSENESVPRFTLLNQEVI